MVASDGQPAQMQGKRPLLPLPKLGLELSKREKNRLAAGLERCVDALPIGWRPLLEDYAEGNRVIHVHFKAHDTGPGGLDLPYSPDLCATFQWPESPLVRDLKGVIRGWFAGPNSGNLTGTITMLGRRCLSQFQSSSRIANTSRSGSRCRRA